MQQKKINLFARNKETERKKKRTENKTKSILHICKLFVCNKNEIEII
jgi:hypothetical protein